jgi:hypothetical protein
MAQRWKQLSRRWKALAIVAALGVVAIAPLQLATVVPASAATALQPTDAGYIDLQMNSQGNKFTYVPLSGSNTTQTFRSASCSYTPVSPSSGFNLMALSSSPSTGTKVGYLTSSASRYGLGVNNTGVGEGTGKCTQINNYASREVLDLSLQNAAGQAMSGKYIDYMELDIEAKFNATINVELWKEGVQVGTEVISCTSSDCGPDSSDGDNFRVRVPATGETLFDQIKLYATGPSGGAVTLEAGADGTLAYGAGDSEVTGLGETKGTNDSLFHIVQLGEGVLDCGGNSVATEGAAVTLTRLDGGDPTVNPDGTPCIPINYDLTRSGNTVDFIKDAAQDPSAAFEVEVNAWDPEPAANPIPASTVFPPAEGETIVWCDGTAAEPTMPDAHYWCLIDISAELVPAPDGETGNWMQVSETVLLEGDARITRG